MTNGAKEDRGQKNAISAVTSLLNGSLRIQNLLFAKNSQESEIKSSRTDTEGKNITKKPD